MIQPADLPRYPYVVVELAESEADEAGALLFDLGAVGVEQRDAKTLVRPPGDKVILAAAFPGEHEARCALGSLPSEWFPRIDYVVGDGWRDEWKRHFEPFLLCEGVVVRPPWRAYSPVADERVITLEPGRAFGTGLHETTRLVAEALAARRPGVCGSQVLDVGCGSGILALAAVALGAAAVRAIDVDPEAVAVTRDNAEHNGVTGRVRADSTPVDALRERYAIVLANIEATTLMAIAAPLASRLTTRGTLVLSGILGPEVAQTQWESVRRAYADLHVEQITQKGEWIAAVLRS
jgi:ribosomal protein L11 methyltransferase